MDRIEVSSTLDTSSIPVKATDELAILVGFVIQISQLAFLNYVYLS